MQLVTAHAKRLERSGDYDGAEQAYRRGLDADELIEQFYQGLMRCHLAQGQRAEGMDVFRRLRHVLSVTLNVDPIAESHALFHSLQKQDLPHAPRPA